MIKACDNEVNQCLPCDDSPVENLSAELPDLPTNLGIVTIPLDPELNDVWTARGCIGWAFSTISIADAEQQAAEQQCGQAPPPPEPPPVPTRPPVFVWPDFPITSCVAGADPISPLVPKVVTDTDTIWTTAYTQWNIFQGIFDDLVHDVSWWNDALTPPHDAATFDGYCCWVDYNGGNWRLLVKQASSAWQYFEKRANLPAQGYKRACNCTAYGGVFDPCTTLSCVDIGTFIGYENTTIWSTDPGIGCPYAHEFVDFYYALSSLPMECFDTDSNLQECITRLWPSWLFNAVAPLGVTYLLACPWIDLQESPDATHTIPIPTRIARYSSGGGSSARPLYNVDRAIREGADSATPAGTYIGAPGWLLDCCENRKTKFEDAGTVVVTHEVPPP